MATYIAADVNDATADSYEKPAPELTALAGKIGLPAGTHLDEYSRENPADIHSDNVVNTIYIDAPNPEKRIMAWPIKDETELRRCIGEIRMQHRSDASELEDAVGEVTFDPGTFAIAMGHKYGAADGLILARRDLSIDRNNHGGEIETTLNYHVTVDQIFSTDRAVASFVRETGIAALADQILQDMAAIDTQYNAQSEFIEFRTWLHGQVCWRDAEKDFKHIARAMNDEYWHYQDLEKIIEDDRRPDGGRLDVQDPIEVWDNDYVDEAPLSRAEIAKGGWIRIPETIETVFKPTTAAKAELEKFIADAKLPNLETISSTEINPDDAAITRNPIGVSVVTSPRPDYNALLVFSTPGGRKVQEITPELLALVVGNHPRWPKAEFIRIDTVGDNNPRIDISTKELGGVLEKYRPLDMKAAREAAERRPYRPRANPMNEFNELEFAFAVCKNSLLIEREKDESLKIRVTRHELQTALFESQQSPETMNATFDKLSGDEMKKHSATETFLLSGFARDVAQPEWVRNPETNKSYETGRILRGQEGLKTLLEHFGANSKTRFLHLSRDAIRFSFDQNSYKPNMASLNIIENTLIETRRRDADAGKPLAQQRMPRKTLDLGH